MLYVYFQRMLYYYSVQRSHYSADPVRRYSVQMYLLSPQINLHSTLERQKVLAVHVSSSHKVLLRI